jgi:hypothetical protein
MWLLALAALAAEAKPAACRLDEPGKLAARFFDGGSGIWPACFGVLILCAGFFGLVGLGDFQGCDWLYYSVEGGLGSYLLKRTFTMN